MQAGGVEVDTLGGPAGLAIVLGRSDVPRPWTRRSGWPKAVAGVLVCGFLNGGLLGPAPTERARAGASRHMGSDGPEAEGQGDMIKEDCGQKAAFQAKLLELRIEEEEVRSRGPLAGWLRLHSGPLVQPSLQIDPAPVEEVLSRWQLVQRMVEVACQEPWASLEEQGGGLFRDQELGWACV